MVRKVGRVGGCLDDVVGESESGCRTLIEVVGSFPLAR